MLLLIFTLSLVSAEHYYTDSNYKYSKSYPYKYSKPSFNSAYSSNAHYEESPGLQEYPRLNSNKKASFNSKDSNFDSSSYAYDYRGPLYERTITYLDDFAAKRTDKQGFFSSKSSDKVRRTIQNTITEKYTGASESIFANSQNRRLSSQDLKQDESIDYNAGFSFGKQRLFDSQEYANSRSSYSSPYYYRPYYDSKKGYYNWRY